MGDSHKHLVDDDVYMYPIDMNPDKRADYLAICRASKASELNRQQE